MLLCAYIYPLFARPAFGRDRVAEVIRPMIQLVKLFDLVAPRSVRPLRFPQTGGSTQPTDPAYTRGWNGLESSKLWSTPWRSSAGVLLAADTRAIQASPLDLAFLQVLLEHWARYAENLIRSLEAGLGRTEIHHTRVVFEAAGDTVGRQFQE